MRLFLPLALAAVLVGCGAPEEADVAAEAPVSYASYGAEIPVDQPAIPAADVILAGEQYAGETVRIEGEIEKVCQMKGCWLTLRGAGDTDATMAERIRVEVQRDSAGQYVYTFPTDLAEGQPAIFEGAVRLDTTSVDMQRHFAEDEGKTAEEIAAITEPRLNVVLTARGARVAAAAAPASLDASTQL
jgi:hypothetical protein